MLKTSNHAAHPHGRRNSEFSSGNGATSKARLTTRFFLD
jgi:hypothetical protein